MRLRLIFEAYIFLVCIQDLKGTCYSCGGESDNPHLAHMIRPVELHLIDNFVSSQSQCLGFFPKYPHVLTSKHF